MQISSLAAVRGAVNIANYCYDFTRHEFILEAGGAKEAYQHSIAKIYFRILFDFIVWLSCLRPYIFFFTYTNATGLFLIIKIYMHEPYMYFCFHWYWHFKTIYYFITSQIHNSFPSTALTEILSRIPNGADYFYTNSSCLRNFGCS